MSQTTTNKISLFRFLQDLKVGDLVEARFTNIAGWHRFPAKIVKVNEKTVRVIRADGKSVWKDEDPNREFSILKFDTSNNGIFPLGNSITSPSGGF